MSWKKCTVNFTLVLDWILSFWVIYYFEIIYGLLFLSSTLYNSTILNAKFNIRYLELFSLSLTFVSVSCSFFRIGIEKWHYLSFCQYCSKRKRKSHKKESEKHNKLLNKNVCDLEPVSRKSKGTEENVGLMLKCNKAGEAM